MTYCTPDDVRLLTGITPEDTPDSIITSLIETASRRCNTRIDSANLPRPEEPYADLLRDAAAHITAALLIDRKRIELSRPAGLSVDGLSFSTSPDTEIQRHEILAKAALENYISEALKQAGEPTGTIIMMVEGE